MPEESAGQGVELLSKEAMEDLMQNGEGPVVPDFQLQTVPAVIHLKDAQSVFVISEPNNWGFTKQGVFATGEWDGSGDEKDCLFPLTSIEFIEYDFSDIAAAIQQQQAAAASNESAAQATGADNATEDGASTSD